ncbi:MAG: hypothetical protein P8Y66_04565 [Nitrospirota bacterium]|jgi:hypothetical protein
MAGPARSKAAILLMGATLAVVAFWLFWPSDEARIRKLLTETVHAVEEEDLPGVLSPVAFQYTDNHGLSYLLLKRTLQREFRHFEDIDVQMKILSVEVDGEEAVARLDLLVLATRDGERGYFFGGLKEPAHAVLYLKKNTPRGWRIERGEYEPGE